MHVRPSFPLPYMPCQRVRCVNTVSGPWPRLWPFLWATSRGHLEAISRGHLSWPSLVAISCSHLSWPSLVAISWPALTPVALGLAQLCAHRPGVTAAHPTISRLSLCWVVGQSGGRTEDSTSSPPDSTSTVLLRGISSGRSRGHHWRPSLVAVSRGHLSEDSTSSPPDQYQHCPPPR